MNVLFFLEPSIEFGNPTFRYATLRNSFIPQMQNMQREGWAISTVVSTVIAEKCIEDNYLPFMGNVIAVDPIDWVDGEGYLQRSLRHLSNEYRENEINRIKTLISDRVHVNYSPDIIIAWETPVSYFEQIYPNAKIIYQMPGFFSRPPFANLISFSHKLCDYPKITPEKPMESDLITLNEMRLRDYKFFNEINPTSKELTRLKNNFDKIILFPLQVDNYFMVNSVTGAASNQFDLLSSLLSHIPTNIAILVTNYKSKDTQSSTLNEQTIKYLKKKYPNFVFFTSFDSIPNVSQFLVSAVDGVITISSSVGYQASYWKKPLFTLGESHISEFATSTSLEEFVAQVKDSKEIERDSKIIDILSRRHVPASFTKSPGYLKWIEEYSENGFFTKWSDQALGQIMNEEFRPQHAMSSLKHIYKTMVEKDDLHCKPLSLQISKHDIISFDIFDTLLFRPFRHPTDLYDYLSEVVKKITGISSLNFKSERKKAEKIAFENAVKQGRGEITLDEIYSVLASSISITDTVATEIKQQEMDAERDLLYPRLSGYKAFQEAKFLGKRIIIVSDMYLPEVFLADILLKNGYKGYEKLYVSSTYGAKKHNGALFDIVLNDLNIQPNQLLHIGDNLEADVKKASARNIKAFHLPKSYDEYTSNSDYQLPWARDEQRHSLDWRILLAIAGNSLHDNPYLPFRKNTLFGASPVKLGYYGFGFLLLGFTKWLVEVSIKDKIERLYFLSRDGKIMKEAYDIVSKLYPNAPTSHYLYCSRRAVNLAKVKTVDDIIDLANVDYANNVQLSLLLKNRFNIEISEIPTEVLAKHSLTLDSRLKSNDPSKLQSLLIDIQDVIIDLSATERRNYLEYLNAEGLFSEGKVSIVDIGYAGTMQQSLFQLSERKKAIGGYYLITFRQALKRVVSNELDIKAFLAEFVDRHDTYHPFCRHVPLYETLFSSTETSFVKMGKDWNNQLTPIFMPRTDVEEKREKVVEDIQKGALSFINQVSTILGNRLATIDVEPNKSLRVLDFYFTNPHPRDAKIFSGVMFEDAYGGARYKTILPLDNSIKSECVWKNGQRSLLSVASATEQHGVVGQNYNITGPEKKIKMNVSNELVSLNEYGVVSKSYKGKLIHWLLIKTLPEKKRNKFINKPHLFFSDSRNSLIKRLGRAYFLSK
ncbi:hypothetical protein C2U48_18300 [Escherichia coli]|uniref:HAD-IA family hydrolase n=1 Tax=Enterobacteriaceae TaxID=543 RepID=UPI000CD14DEB|nr:MULTISPECIES: HAD-IA family hydrolase [Enterobacteriaceae]AUV32489.1 hypothetical protein C2U48_18300 [Escherichia coli]EGJ7729475.1 HAD-IA family hydrolase [Escherichia coli]MCK6978691.1 HAD-IA family hydrolase [Enterobacter roggenkampii]MWG03573.1 HAD-IA family hydrolase [Escherichia coli]